MLNDKVVESLMNQMHREVYAAYLYLSMSGYADRENLPGFAAWLRNAARQEMEHYKKLFDFLLHCDVAVQLDEVNPPPNDFDSLVDVFEQVLDHEKRGEDSFKRLYTLATKEDCHEILPTVSWFLESHVQEVNESRRILSRLRMIIDDGAGLLLLDRQLGGSAA